MRQLEEFLSSNYSNFGTEQTSSEEESDTPACLKKKKPKPNWFVVPELLHREIGINPSFQRRYYGSLHVVEHFELMYKLKEHEVYIYILNFIFKRLKIFIIIKIYNCIIFIGLC